MREPTPAPEITALRQERYDLEQEISEYDRQMDELIGDV